MPFKTHLAVGHKAQGTRQLSEAVKIAVLKSNGIKVGLRTYVDHLVKCHHRLTVHQVHELLDVRFLYSINKESENKEIY